MNNLGSVGVDWSATGAGAGIGSCRFAAAGVGSGADAVERDSPSSNKKSLYVNIMRFKYQPCA